MLRSGGFLGQAQALLKDGELPPQTESFVRSLAGGDALGLTQTLVPMEKWKRDALQEILSNWIELLEGALTSRAGGQAVSALSRTLASSLSSPQLYDALKHLKKAHLYCQSNVSPAAICGYLNWALR